MAMNQQQIYEEALSRAGILTSATPLTSPGFPTTFEGYQRMLAMPHGIASLKRMTSHSQLARFEAEMHNIGCEQEHKKSVAATELAAKLKKEAKQKTLRAEYQTLSSEEIQLFEAFKEAEEMKKREKEAAAARKAAEEASAREEEKASAIRLFREILANYFKPLYSELEDEILRVGKIMKEIGPGGIGWPHGLVKMWREKRYTANGILPVNYSMMPGQQWIAQGNEADGWPLQDEADAEVRKLLDEEWKMYLNFCLRYTERKEETK